MIAQLASTAQILEAAMLICFGISWPIDIIKALRSRHTEGKSLAFMVIIAIGYVCGVAGKFSQVADGSGWPQWVTWLYLLNAVLVSFDIALYLRFRNGRDSRSVL